MRWATLAVAAPELLSLFAIMQWNAANISVKEMRSLGIHTLSSVHAFYANAGGFLLEAPDAPAFPVNATSICYLVSKGRIDTPTITKEEIWDKSKADLFAKCVAFVQAGWLLCAMIGCAVQKLPITPLELFTIAFVVPTMATQYFWANKPQNIGAPVTVKVEWTISEILLEAGDAASDAWVDTPMDFIEKPIWQGWKRRLAFSISVVWTTDP
jgi:squalene monooxygenase